jgi:hypothetical protein
MRRESPWIVVQSALLAAVVVTGALDAWAQTPGGGSPPAAQTADRADDVTALATRIGHELTVGVGGYTYVEPEDVDISIYGPKLTVEYTGTLSLGAQRRWFVEAGLRASGGTVAYDGWCRPWLIAPDPRSSSGYALGLGERSSCTLSGDADGYVELRALVGRDLFPGRWGVSPAAGVGVRYLSNSTTGIRNFRTDTYLYVPLGITARTRAGSGRILSVNVEYDILLRGWQTTRQSQVGGGRIEATSTAPPFTIDRFTDFSFAQHRGWAMRAGAKYQLTRRWSVAPRFIHWRVSDSEVAFSTVTFTVNSITAKQELGAIEPVNSTDEWSLNVGFHF